jgi:hypothetical protein
MDGQVNAWLVYWGRLQDLWVTAGCPSSRKIKELSGTTISHATFNAALKGERLVSQETSRALWEALGGDPEESDRLWADARHQANRTLPESSIPTSRTVLADALRSIDQRLERIERRLP